MIEQILVWLWRIGRCRGFGIQSPWAYSFVRYVINEHYPYYAYPQLNAEAEKQGLTNIEKKRALLYFRIANFLQADHAASIGITDYTTYLRRGCNKTQVESVEHIADADATLLLVGNAAIPSSDILQWAADGRMLIIENIGIGRNTKARKLWKELLKADRGMVSFDLHYCGVIYFDSKRHNQNHIVKI